MYENDKCLPGIGSLTTGALQAALDNDLPPRWLGAPVSSYRVCNIRYKPTQKLVVGMVSDLGGNPVALRVLPRREIPNRLAKARRNHQERTAHLRAIDAVAWVFPAERKLKLEMVADINALDGFLRDRCGFSMSDHELMHFVPEHAYTARVRGLGSTSDATQVYLKAYADNGGATAAQLMARLRAASDGTNIQVPAVIHYEHRDRLLVQEALPRVPGRTLSAQAMAGALAQFHRLPCRGVGSPDDGLHRQLGDAAALVEFICPRFSPRFAAAAKRVRDCYAAANLAAPVLLHGDAHLGNFFLLENGKVGVIDFDRTAMGPPEFDLASYYAFSLWLAMRQGKSPETLLNRLPTFVGWYNAAAPRRLDAGAVYVVVAATLLTERVARGLRRGKLATIDDVGSFIDMAERCIEAAGDNYGG